LSARYALKVWSSRPSVQEGRSCRYYCATSQGVRCVFMAPEEWRARQHALREYCVNGGSGCSVKARFLSRISKGRFLGEAASGAGRGRVG